MSIHFMWEHLKREQQRRSQLRNLGLLSLPSMKIPQSKISSDLLLISRSLLMTLILQTKNMKFSRGFRRATKNYQLILIAEIGVEFSVKVKNTGATDCAKYSRGTICNWIVGRKNTPQLISWLWRQGEVKTHLSNYLRYTVRLGYYLFRQSQHLFISFLLQSPFSLSPPNYPKPGAALRRETPRHFWARYANVTGKFPHWTTRMQFFFYAQTRSYGGWDCVQSRNSAIPRNNMGKLLKLFSLRAFGWKLRHHFNFTTEKHLFQHKKSTLPHWSHLLRHHGMCKWTFYTCKTLEECQKWGKLIPKTQKECPKWQNTQLSQISRKQKIACFSMSLFWDIWI